MILSMFLSTLTVEVRQATIVVLVLSVESHFWTNLEYM